MWHCPHCGAPQAESARCWVCRRSSTTCSTCTHFRRALAGDLGYCGLDSKRRSLTGSELRGCWEERPAAGEPDRPGAAIGIEPHRLRSGAAAPSSPADGGREAPAHHPRGFVPVELVSRDRDGRAQRPSTLTANPDPQPTLDAPPPTDAPPAFLVEPEPAWDERTSLFGDLEG